MFINDTFLSNTSTKRVQGYGNIGLAHNTIRTYKSLFHVIKIYETEISKRLYLNPFYKYTIESFTKYSKIDKQFYDIYYRQITK
jgi:hypothetical protein